MTSNNLGELSHRLRQLAQVPVLLVASDYDGVLAPLVDDPMQATASRQSVAALRALSELNDTHVAVVSGRSLRDLAIVSRLPSAIRLVGSHGGEFDYTFTTSLSDGLLALKQELVSAVEQLGRKYRALTEVKPSGVTFHFRGMEKAAQQAARDELVRGPAGLEGVFTRTGHDIIEMSVLDTNKGSALDKLRGQIGASAVVFLGDDITDEDGFRTLRGPDVGVHVGTGHTSAHYRVSDTDTVGRILALLSEFRREWLRGAALTPIQSHSVLSDQRTAAIISPSANVTWMCTPRIDSSAVFGDLLGGAALGTFAITDAEGAGPVKQAYVRDTMVLRTTFPGFTVTDYLDASGQRTGQLADRTDLIRVLDGTGACTVTFAPRPNFGRVATSLEPVDGALIVRGTADQMVLLSPGVEWKVTDIGRHQQASATIELTGEPIVLELRGGTESSAPDRRSEKQRRAETKSLWSEWASQLRLPHLERTLVARSALFLKSLSHGPTGAIVSAATTSLPAHLGGRRNWDHRYCWIRDASFTASALARLGSVTEGAAFLTWLNHQLEMKGEPDRLAPVYNVTGRHLPPEAQISTIAGYAGSRPVRIGHAADGQLQIDMFGAVVELVHDLRRAGHPLTDAEWHLVEAMVVAVSRRWNQPDHGIWQSRLKVGHHVHTKVMCWVAVDRAINLAEEFLDRAPGAWTDLRDQIATEVVARAWNPSLGSFTGSYDTDEIDASVLSIGLRGLVSPSDERFVSTVSTVEAELLDGPVVRRYRHDDGLPGEDGGHLLMTSWLVDALAAIGRRDDAIDLFKGVCDFAGPTGVLPELWDPNDGRALGNIPHAQSHVGVINNALNLDV